MGRTPCCEKVGMKKGKWAEEEDEILVKYIAENGEGSWSSLPRNAGLLRCGKSCRLRWVNYLRAGVRRGNISKEEEEIIIKLHASHGNRWSFIAKHMPGRTDNEIKNYWNCHLNRRLQTFTRNGETIIIDLGTVPGGSKRRNNHTNSAGIKIPSSNPTRNLKPPSTSCVEEHNKMIQSSDTSSFSGINTSPSFDFDLDWVFPSPQAWVLPHVDCDVEGVGAMSLEDHATELSTFMWESSI